MRTRRTSVTGSARGFTLIELLAVLTILVIAAAMVPLALNRAIPGRRVAAASDRLVALVREAQAESVRSGRSLRVSSGPEGLQVKSGETALPGLRLEIPTNVNILLKDASGATVPGFSVFPDGSAQAAVLEVESDGHRRAIRISALTGHIAVEAL